MATLPYITNSSFLKNTIKSEPLGVRGQYFQDFHIFMIPTTDKNFKKIYEVKVTCPGLFKMELPNSDFFFFLSANVAIITLKMYFIYFHISSYQGNIFLYQNLYISISSNYNRENWGKQIKITEENLSQSFILCQLLRTKTLASGSKCIKHFFYFYHNVSYICWVHVIYWTCLVVLKSTWWLN